MSNFLYSNILEIHKLLEKCRFGKFWEELQAEHDMIIEFEGFEDSIRNYICGVVSASFQRLSLENLKEFLGVSRSGSKAFGIFLKILLSLFSSYKPVSFEPWQYC